MKLNTDVSGAGYSDSLDVTVPGLKPGMTVTKIVYFSTFMLQIDTVDWWIALFARC